MNKIASLIYKTVFITISFLAIYNMILNMNLNTLAYFTNLSNILVFIVMLMIWIKTLKDVLVYKKYEGYNEYFIKIKMIATLAIFVTGLVYSTMLAKYNEISNYSVSNLSVHYIIPVLMVLDYFLFDKKGLMKWYMPFVYAASVALYLPYIFIRAWILGPNTSLLKYPYFFLNLDKLGGTFTSLWCIGLILFFTFLAFLIYIYDHKKARV